MSSYGLLAAIGLEESLPEADAATNVAGSSSSDSDEEGEEEEEEDGDNDATSLTMGGSQQTFQVAAAFLAAVLHFSSAIHETAEGTTMVADGNGGNALVKAAQELRQTRWALYTAVAAVVVLGAWNAWMA